METSKNIEDAQWEKVQRRMAKSGRTKWSDMQNNVACNAGSELSKGRNGRTHHYKNDYGARSPDGKKDSNMNHTAY